MHNRFDEFQQREGVEIQQIADSTDPIKRARGKRGLEMLNRIQRKSKVTAISNDFRVFAAAFDTYAQETGGWPAEAAAGVFPAGMDQRINKTAWRRKTPMGGQYNADVVQNGIDSSTIKNDPSRLCA